jgi:hypothetical protein
MSLALLIAITTASNQVIGTLAGTHQAIIPSILIFLLKPLAFGGFLYLGSTCGLSRTRISLELIKNPSPGSNFFQATF